MATRHGPGLTADSVNYLWMAQGLVEARAMRGVAGTELTVFPPGYPALLALGEGLGLSPLVTIRVLGAASWAVVVTCTGAAVRRRVPTHPWLAVAAAAVVATAAPLFGVMRMAWSEPPFLAVVMLTLVLADRCRAEGVASRGRVVALIGLVWAATLLRFSGLALVPAVAIALWQVAPDPHRGPVPRPRWLPSRLPSAPTLFVVGALVGPAGWMLRNLVVDGTLLGPRNESTATPAGELADLMRTIARWVAPTPTAALLALVGAAAVGVLVARRPEVDPPDPAGATTGTTRPSSPGSGVVWVVFVGGFTVLTLWSRLTTQIDSLGDRLLSPVFAPIVVLLAIGAARLLAPFEHGGDLATPATPSVARRALAAVVAGWVVVSFVGSILAVRQLEAQEGSHLARRFDGSALVDRVAELPTGAVVLSNQAEALAYLSQRPVVMDPPARTDYGWTPADPTAQQLRSQLSCATAPVYFAWFDRTPPHFLTPAELPPTVSVTPVDRVADGAVYRLSSSVGATDCGP